VNFCAYLEDVVDYLLSVGVRRLDLTWRPLQNAFEDSQSGLDLQVTQRRPWLDEKYVLLAFASTIRAPSGLVIFLYRDHLDVF
jgi:hypothetical protein